MSLFTKKIFYGIALTIAAVAFFGCSQPVDPPVDITWTAEANGASGATTSTQINFVFDAAVTGLTAEQITLTNGTGAVTKGVISGDGVNWSLGLTVGSAGNITVAIDKTGVESEAKTVLVHKQAAVSNPGEEESGPGEETPAPVAYTITADGTSGATTSTKIDFVFNAAVEGLTAEQITLTNGTGIVTKGDLTGSGANWSLEISVDSAGDITVAINKTGIANGAKTLTVHKQGEATPAPVAYTITADGENGVTTSTKIDFDFYAAVEVLTAEQITLTNGTGAVAKGDLTGNDVSWSLEITVDSAGGIKVSINKPGIENMEKDLTVHKGEPAPELTAAVSPVWGNTGDGWAKGSISGEGPAQAITLSVVEEPLAYFVILKTAEQTITVGGADEATVTRLEDGVSHGDKTASNLAALFTVNMEDLLFDGAFGSLDADMIPTGTETRSFTLTVSEEGKASRVIAVSLNITLDPETETSIYHREGTPGNYYYVKVRDSEGNLPKLTAADGSHYDEYEDDFTAFNEGSVTDLQNAFVWVDHHGEGGNSNVGYENGTTEGYSEYRLFVKQSQQIGKMGFVIVNEKGQDDSRDNISIELYGVGTPGLELKITRNPSYANRYTQMLNFTGYGDGFISLTECNGWTKKHKAVVLGKNITIDVEASSADPFTGSGSTPLRNLRISYLIDIRDNGMFIMNDYSKLTGCYAPGTGSSLAVIRTNSGNGKFIMNGGAITGNIVPQYLVYGEASKRVINGGSLAGNVNTAGTPITATNR
jgi:hypothetical protein